MSTLTTASGRTIPCDSVAHGYQFENYLHIRTNALTMVEAVTIFADAAETETLVYSDADASTEYSGYTELIGVGIDPLLQRPGELLIRLRRNA